MRETGNVPIPLHLRNAPTKLMKELGYGKTYKYSHDYEGNFVEQQYMPDSLNGSQLWRPCNNQQEMSMLERLRKWWGKRF